MESVRIIIALLIRESTKGCKMNRFRRLLYRLASLLGDVNAIRTGHISQRIVHKTATRTVNRIINNLLRGK